jgi:MOSC domain-containing protein YiiM
MDADLPWTTRQANLLVDKLTFSPVDVGRTLRIGDIELEITQETDPCSRMTTNIKG